MNSIVTLLIGNIEVVQIVIIGSIGSLVGELFKEVNDDTPVVFVKFIAKFLASWFTSVIMGLMLKTYILEEQQLAVIALTGALAFGGHQRTTVLMNSLIDKIIELRTNQREE